MSHIAVIILAAGTSSRAGTINKLLSPYNGKPMVASVVTAATGLADCSVSIVVGHQAEEVQAALAGYDVNFINNPQFEAGMSTSLKCAIEALPSSVTGALICLGDMPRIETRHLQTLIEAFEGTSSICVPMFEGQQGNPVLWGRQFFDDILTLSGDVGAKSLLKKYADHIQEVDMPDDAVLFDIDRP